jgi:acyl-CoA oxidase
MSDFTDKLRPAEPSGPSILEHERAQSDINVDQLARHLLSRNDFLNRQQRILSIIKDIPYFNKKNQLNMARPDRYHLGLARAKNLKRLSIKHRWDDEDYKMADYLMDEMGPYALQFTMFATSIREQCSEEQRKYWLPKLDNWEIIGCYGQTELGHGSNVKGIECQAKWDPKSKEFIIHSPTLTASKWWNGALGRTANHAIVVAQLLLPDGPSGNYKSYGPHQFIVQIRDMKTHKPLEGIVIGDIGPKYGYTAMDNGYMLFQNLRVPHSALLSKYSGIDSEHGTYIKPDNPAVVYGSLTFVRAQIIMHARLVLARAVTIATRYLSIRRQFSDRDSKDPEAPEQAVLNYPTVQIRILPLLATTFALHYTGEAMYKLYYGTRAEIEQSGDFSRLAEMHAASSGLKSLSTMLAADGIETCRRAMGGHGFGGGSGMIPLNNDYLSKPTVEGDNWMITQQTASYLIKRMTFVIQNPNKPSREPIDNQLRSYMQSLNSHSESTFDILSSDEALVHAFQHRLSYLAYQVYIARVEQKKPWTDLMISLHNLSRAHSQQLLVSNFHTAVFSASTKEDSSSPSLTDANIQHLQVLFRLFALYTLSSNASEFLLSSTLTTDQLRAVDPLIQSLMAQIRPHAVRLVDAWSIPDYLLESSLGRYDGDVYNDLFRKAHLENPLNLETFNPDWKTEEIVMGEGAEHARERLEKLAMGVQGHEQRGGRAKL